MSTLPRKQLHELKTTYELEPTLKKDIYVEGLTDKEIISFFLKRIGKDDVCVYEINTVDISDELVKDAGFAVTNNRSRVATLCSILDQYIYGVIDSDFDFIEPQQYATSVLTTDFTAMEIYLFNEKAMEKLFMIYPALRPSNYTAFLKEISEILHEAFLIRYAKEKLDKRLSHRPFTKETVVKKKIITFNRNKYLEKYLSSNSSKIEDFNKYINEIRQSIDLTDFTNYKYFIHGHDFIEILLTYLDITQKDTCEHFSKFIYTLLDWDDLEQSTLFSTIKNSI